MMMMMMIIIIIMIIAGVLQRPNIARNMALGRQTAWPSLTQDWSLLYV
jgi:hypothetical protein